MKHNTTWINENQIKIQIETNNKKKIYFIVDKSPKKTIKQRWL